MTGAPSSPRWSITTSSQQRAAQNEQRHVEINYQAGDIDQCSNEWRGRRRRIQSDTRGADGKSNQPMILPVVKDVQILPERDSEKTDGSKNQAKRQSRKKLLADHAKPITQTQFTQSHRADNQCCRLRSGIAAFSISPL